MVTSIRGLVDYLCLPAQVSSFEARYLQRMNRIALGFFWIHVPALMLVAALSGTSVLLATILSLGVVVGPTLGYFALAARPRLVSMVHGFTAMVMGGVLVYVGQGPLQIEMHFYFFVLIALLAVFGNPSVIVVAAVTVAVHHLVVWAVIPAAVFNYEASVWTVAVHALFVVLESAAACFVARSFLRQCDRAREDRDGKNRRSRRPQPGHGDDSRQRRTGLCHCRARRPDRKRALADPGELVRRPLTRHAHLVVPGIARP